MPAVLCTGQTVVMFSVSSYTAHFMKYNKTSEGFVSRYLRAALVSGTTFSKVLCAVIFFLGIFVCLYGHQFFKTETFLLGFLSGGLIFYIIIGAFSTLSASGMNVRVNDFL
jgi:hypothetical protein